MSARTSPVSFIWPAAIPFNVDDRDDPADRHGELDKVGFLKLFRAKRSVGGAEVDCSRHYLLYSAAGAYGLVVELELGLLGVLIGPLGVEGRGEGRASAVQKLG